MNKNKFYYRFSFQQNGFYQRKIPIPYGPRTITVGAGVLEPILLIIGASDVCGLFGVVYEERIDGFFVVEYVGYAGRAGVGPLT